MEKIKKIFKKLRIYYRKRKLYKLAELDAYIMCSSYFRALPPEVYIEGDKETMLRETQRVMRECRQRYDELHAEEKMPADQPSEKTSE